MTMQDDWRLLPRHEQLSGVTLIRQPWKPANPQNDHDHCEFCWEKFADYDGCLHAGYSTEDRVIWICDECFCDFKERFKWKVRK